MGFSGVVVDGHLTPVKTGVMKNDTNPNNAPMTREISYQKLPEKIA